jgi:hypothetical protein
MKADLGTTGLAMVPSRRPGQTLRPRCLFSLVARYAGWLTQVPDGNMG